MTVRWASAPLGPSLVIAPPAEGEGVGKPLFGPLARCHGARRGTYCIVYRINENSCVVHVLDIDHRSEIYRRPQP